MKHITKIFNYKIIIFILIALLGLTTEVNAADADYMDIICRYSIPGQARKCLTETQNMCAITNHTHTFNMSYNSKTRTWKIGDDYYDAFSFESKKPKWLSFGEGNSCPNITIYHRKPTVPKYYILNETFNNQCQKVMQETTSDPDKIKYDDYTCSRIIGVFGGDDITETIVQDCPSKKTNALKKDIKNSFDNKVKKAFNNEYNRLNNDAKSFNGQTTKEMCEAYGYNADILTDAYQRFLDDRSNLISNMICTIDPTIAADIKDNYSSTGRRVITYEAQRNSYINSLISTADNNKKLCFTNAVDMDDQQKDDAIEQMLDDSDDQKQTQQDYIDKIHDEANKYVDKISSINLGSDVTDYSCEGLLGTDLLNILDEIFMYIKISAPIIFLVLGSIDFVQAVMMDDKDILKKSTSKFLKRALICLAIFLAPYVISYLLHFLEGMTSDPTCGLK